MAQLKINGKAKYLEIGTGFWGVVGEDGENWRPLNYPKELEKEGLEVALVAEEETEAVSLFMWGRTIRIKEFTSAKP